jgi:hypothetical protein
MANNTNIQFYKDTRLVFETSNGEGKSAIGSADATVQGFEIEYNLSTTPEAFKISPLGINYTSGATNDTTLLPRIAQVGSLLQSVEVPPDATTLQVDKRILLTDGISNGSIRFLGVNTEITSSGDLILNPVGNVELLGNRLELNNGEINNCPLVQGRSNVNILLEGRGTGDVILKTNGVDRLDIRDTGFMDFEGMTYNNNTNSVTTTNFTGLASNATDSVNTNNLDVTTDNTSGNNRLTLAKLDVTGQQPLFIDTGGANSYNPSTGIFTFSVPPTSVTSVTTSSRLLNFENFASSSYSPELRGTSGGAPLYDTQIGRFTKINNCCFWQSYIKITNVNTLSGFLSISLPFTTVGAAVFSVGDVAGLATGAAELTSSTPNATIVTNLVIRATVATTASALLTASDITNTFEISVGGSYFVA